MWFWLLIKGLKKLVRIEGVEWSARQIPTANSVFYFEDYPNVTSIPYTFEPFWHTLHKWDINRTEKLYLFARITAALGFSNP
jgi:hypothetical protein